MRTPALIMATRRSSVSGRMPLKPLASTFARSSIRARVCARVRGSPDARGVRAHQVELQLAQP